MLKKIYLVIDVQDEAQRDRVQQIANELSNMRALNGTQIENIYPYYRQYENDIRQLFCHIQAFFGRQLLVSCNAGF